MLLMGRNAAQSMIRLDALVKFSMTISFARPSATKSERAAVDFSARSVLQIARNASPKTMCHSELENEIMKRLITLVAFSFLLMSPSLASSALAQTQTTAGVIQGTVLDEQGGAVPGANTEVRNVDTNFTRTLTTDSDGRFVFLQLQPGRYLLTVSKQGFATVIQENLELTVGQTINLSLSMKVSRLEEKITITAAPTIDTVKTESSSTLNELSVSNLPVLGRKFEDLLTLTPGVSITQGPDGDEIN